MRNVLGYQKKVQMSARNGEGGEAGGKNTLHTVQKLENANKCNLAIFISFSLLFFAFC